MQGLVESSDNYVCDSRPDVQETSRTILCCISIKLREESILKSFSKNIILAKKGRPGVATGTSLASGLRVKYL